MVTRRSGTGDIAAVSQIETVFKKPIFQYSTILSEA
jgi:hypothetical protein